MKVENIAGLSFKGGRRDNFFFALLEHYPDTDRYFLKSLLQVKDDELSDGNEAIKSWVEKLSISKLILDFPITTPACSRCQLDCPGLNSCSDPDVVFPINRIKEILKEDARLVKENPKKYEQERNLNDEVDFSRDILAKESFEYMLSRPFKRRLKKGFLPYWNRPLDLFIWEYYYDLILNLFNISFDSYGNSSTMLLSRFNYIRRHLGSSLELFESNQQIILIELLRKKIIRKKDITDLTGLSTGAPARKAIIKAIEKNLDIFIYDYDLDALLKNSRAFDSFLLALCGRAINLKQIVKIPSWASADLSKFIIPRFLKQN